VNFSRTTLQAGSQQTPPLNPRGNGASFSFFLTKKQQESPPSSTQHTLYSANLRSQRFTCRPDVPWPRPLLLFEPMQNRRKQATGRYFTGKSVHHDEHIGRFPSADRYTTGPYHLSQPPTPSSIARRATSRRLHLAVSFNCNGRNNHRPRLPAPITKQQNGASVQSTSLTYVAGGRNNNNNNYLRHW
jgi:hypothetical protein